MIIGISGKKQSGKSTSANFIIGMLLYQAGIIRYDWQINSAGQLEVTDLFGVARQQSDGKFLPTIYDIANRTDTNNHFKNQNEQITEPQEQEILQLRDVIKTDDKVIVKSINQTVRLYSFADNLKEAMMRIYGLPEKHFYGSGPDKEHKHDSITWEMHSSFKMFMSKETKAKTGPMSARELMQFFGTDIFRRVNPNIWVNSLMCQIKAETQDSNICCIIPDVRFPEEIEAIHEQGGIVIRLARTTDINASDEHDSETKLDKNIFDWNKFDIVLESGETIDSHCAALWRALEQYNLCFEKSNWIQNILANNPTA